MASDGRAYGYGPPAAHGPVRRGSLVTAGCLGLTIGLLVGACSLAGLAGLAALSPPEAAAVLPSPDSDDMVITVDEDYFLTIIDQSLPEEWQANLKLDLQPGNRLVVGGRVTTSFFGQKVEGDVEGTIGMSARDGQLLLEILDVQVLGFSLGGIGQSLTDKLWGDINEIVNDQMRNGLGEGARITGVTTDDERLTMQVRFEP